MRIDLTKYMINKEKPKGDGEFDYGWCAGDQTKALRYYLSDKVKFIHTHLEGTYQGACYAILHVEDKLILWRDFYGSCSGCDALEGSDGYSYIKDTLQEGNTKQFNTPQEAIDYLNDEENSGYTFWKDAKLELIHCLNKLKEAKQ